MLQGVFMGCSDTHRPAQRGSEAGRDIRWNVQNGRVRSETNLIWESFRLLAAFVSLIYLEPGE